MIPQISGSGITYTQKIVRHNFNLFFYCTWVSRKIISCYGTMTLHTDQSQTALLESSTVWSYRGSRCGSGCETFVDSAFRSGFIVACGFATTAAVDDWFADVDADFPANDAQDIGFWAGTRRNISTTKQMYGNSKLQYVWTTGPESLSGSGVAGNRTSHSITSLIPYLRDEDITYISFRRELITYWFSCGRGTMWHSA